MLGKRRRLNNWCRLLWLSFKTIASSQNLVEHCVHVAALWTVAVPIRPVLVLMSGVLGRCLMLVLGTLMSVCSWKGSGLHRLMEWRRCFMTRNSRLIALKRGWWLCSWLILLHWCWRRCRWLIVLKMRGLLNRRLMLLH